MPDSGWKSLDAIFRAQDRVASRNATAAPVEFGLIESGLILAWDVTLYLNDPEAIAKRLMKPPEAQVAETVVINLLHSAGAALVNATRLALFGAHCDSLCLLRGAFEAAYHAEYFLQNMTESLVWNQIGQIADLKARSKAIRRFDQTRPTEDPSRKTTMRGWLEDRDDPEKTRSRLYDELSAYGTHANPATVALRLSSPVEGVANLGFASVGKTEATQLCASHGLHVLMYVVSQYFEGFSEYLDPQLALNATYEDLAHAFAEYKDRPPRELSLSR